MSSELLNVEKALLFGQAIAEPRKRSKKGVKKYTRRVSVQRRTWFMWENGEAFPDESQLPAIAEVLKLDLVELKRVWEISTRADREIREAYTKPARPRRSNRDEIDLPGVGSCGRMTGARAGHL